MTLVNGLFVETGEGWRLGHGKKVGEGLGDEGDGVSGSLEARSRLTGWA